MPLHCGKHSAVFILANSSHHKLLNFVSCMNWAVPSSNSFTREWFKQCIISSCIINSVYVSVFRNGWMEFHEISSCIQKRLYLKYAGKENLEVCFKSKKQCLWNALKHSIKNETTWCHMTSHGSIIPLRYVVYPVVGIHLVLKNVCCVWERETSSEVLFDVCLCTISVVS